MTCIIIEDEIPAQNILKNYISKISSLELVGTYQSALEANDGLKKQEIDLIFIDINLPDISGMQFVKTLQNPPKIIVTTAYPEYAVESFEIGVINDYLVKPISFDRFLKSINKINSSPKETASGQDFVKAESDYIFINVDKTLHKIYLGKICYLKSDRNYVTVVTDTNRYTFVDALKNWALKLPEEKFIQVHKSFIINTHKIHKIEGNIMYVSNHKIPIGRMYKELVISKLNI